MAENQRKSGYDREHRALTSRIRRALGLLILLAVVFALLFGVLLQGDDGMRPAFKKGQPLLYLRLTGDVKRGDLVCLRLPDGTSVVRRVTAVSGDSVTVREGIAYINGIAERGSYSFTRTDPRPEGPVYPLILRQGELFVLGDAREDAVDSRDFGVVRTDELLGRLIK
jgi:signal peptidase I